MSKPNLIYIFADQLGYNQVGYNGNEFAYTPEIDAIAEDSLCIDNCVSGHPVCAPYRASLFTGKYTTSTGMVINEIRINPCHETIAKVLNKEGYNTSYLGKWHLYANQLGHHEEVKNSYIPVGENRLGFKEFVGYNFHHRYYAPHAYYHKDTNEKVYVDGYEPDVQTDMAIDTLKRLKDENKPFAFFLSIGTPHDPWTIDNVPAKYYERFKDVAFPLPKNYVNHNDKYADMWARYFFKERSKINDWKKVYYAMVANLDENIGRLFKEIKAMGLEENSIIVFTADHGEMFGAHGRRAKNIFYEEAVRVPFLLKAPSLNKGKTDALFNTVDIMPTLLSMMGIDSPKEVEGKDMLPFIKGEKETPINEGSLMMCTGPTAMWGNGFEWRAYRTKQYTYAIYRRDRKEFLFDNINDKYQMNNLVKNPKYKDVLKEIKANMYAEMERIGDDFEKNSFYKKHWVEDRIIKEKLIRRKEL